MISLSRARLVAALALCAAAAGCGRFGTRYWEPTAGEREVAVAVARLHVLQHRSDQAGTPEVMALAPDAGDRLKLPVVFTVEGVPFARYRYQAWGEVHEGIRAVVIAWFDPDRFPEGPPPPDAPDAFPSYFRVRVDPAARRAIP